MTATSINRQRRLALLGAGFAALAATGAMTGCASTPSQPNIVATLSADPKFSTLVSLVGQAGLADALSAPGPFTVFAPTNEAFAKVPAARLATLRSNPDQLRAVLQFHVIPGAVMAADVRQGNVRTISNRDLPLSIAGAFVTVDDGVVTRPNIRASNGIIHEIDAVNVPNPIIPPPPAPAPAPAAAPAAPR